MRRYDIVLYGGTGVTGWDCLKYLVKHSPHHIDLAVCGRRPQILEEMVAKIGRPVDVLFADSSRPQSLHDVAAKTKVLATTVGPYAKYGEPVIEACVQQGTDYVDITGETPFIRRMIDLYDHKARSRGIRVIPFCGFDSVPSDMGTFYLSQLMAEGHGEGLRKVKTFFKLKGGLNGGTVASALNMAETGDGAQLRDPLLLTLPEHQTKEERRRQLDDYGPVYDPDVERWTVPFVMALVNGAVVRRSNSLMRSDNRPYGPGFVYKERLLTSRSAPRFSAYANYFTTTAAMGAMASGLGRRVLRSLAPRPGAGPSEKAKDDGFFECTMVGEAPSGRQKIIQARYQGDPGNRATVTFLAQAALTLVEDRGDLPGGTFNGGVLTPATGLGKPYLERLAANGLAWQVQEETSFHC